MDRADLLDVKVQRTGTTLVVTLAGELDHATTPGLQAQLDDQLDDAVDLLAIECEHLRFIDSGGLHLIVDVHRRLSADGRTGRVQVRRPVEQVARSLEVTGVAGIIEIVPATDA